MQVDISKVQLVSVWAYKESVAFKLGNKCFFSLLGYLISHLGEFLVGDFPLAPLQRL